MVLDEKVEEAKNEPSSVNDIELSDVSDLKDGNAQDRRDMLRMGKAQELKASPEAPNTPPPPGQDLAADRPDPSATSAF